MTSTGALDRIDSRIFLWLYGATALPLGLYIAAWGGLWIPESLTVQSELPWRAWVGWSVVRVGGTVVVAAACCAIAFARIENPADRRRCVGWFAAGHGVVLGMMLLQREAIWPPGIADWIVRAMAATTLVLFYAWSRAAGDFLPRGLRTLFVVEGDRSVPERLQSEYETHIRSAAAQEERHRLARDLHDSIKQQIFVVQTAAATAQARLDTDSTGARAALDAVRSAGREASLEMDALLDQLRAVPLENVGLVEALKKQCEALRFRTGAEVDVAIGVLPPSGALSPGARQALFRVAQEALANVGRHARARHVRVELNGSPAGLVLKIGDDGAGFDVARAPAGMGLSNMRARAEESGGTLNLTSRPGAGTTVEFSVPAIVGEAKTYRQKALRAAMLLAIVFAVSVLPSPSGQPTWGIVWIVMIAMALDVLRYAIAWRRSARFDRVNP